MLRLASYDIVFQEIPGEVALALNLSGCPNRCEGCHSPHLRGDIGQSLDERLLEGLLDSYGGAVTCVCFMGGDAEPEEVERLALFVKKWGARPDACLSEDIAARKSSHSEVFDGFRLKTAWYSGRDIFPDCCSTVSFDYVKLGPYIPACGGLRSPDTNQRMYKILHGKMIDITWMFK